MNQKVFIKQDGTIPGCRIIQELKKRGGINEYNNIGLGDSGAYYYISYSSVIIYSNSMGAASIKLLIEQGYTELLYNKETDSFYEKSQRIVSAEAKEALLPEYEFKEYYISLLRENTYYIIPDGYEAKIEDGKVVIRKKQWIPKNGEKYYVCKFSFFSCRFTTEDAICNESTFKKDLEESYAYGNFFKTKEEAQAFCDKLNAAILPILEERRDNG